MAVGKTCSLLCVGHPLLDIQVTKAEELLIKYDLVADNGILASEKHLPIYEEVLNNYQVTCLSAGAAQNTARGAAYILPPNSVVFAGCVGDDEFAQILRAANGREGVVSLYEVNRGARTGVCAVLLTSQNRSLVTALHSAKMLTLDYIINSPDVYPYKLSARVFYIEGYILSHRADAALHLAEFAHANGKIFALNLSAPYIPLNFKSELEQLVPYCDILICNQAEAVAWAISHDLSEQTDICSIAKSIASLPSRSPSRLVIVTQGPQSTICVDSKDPQNFKIHPVPALRDGEIVDTNGAGDAFAGGFLAAYISGKAVDKCIQVGHRLAALCVGQVGPQYKWPRVDVLNEENV